MHSEHPPSHGLAQLDYEQTRPEQSTLYQVVAQYAQTLFAEAEVHGRGYPSDVKREFERYLRCKQYCCGFARLQCKRCGYERIVPYTCKARTVCSSCVARRMADTAAHLVDHVLPDCGYRLWTLSLPWRIRLPVARDPALLTQVIKVLVRTVSAYQRKRTRARGIGGAKTGAVTFVQLWGSALQLTPHAHCWFPEGVFTQHADGTVVFHPLPPPTAHDMAKLCARIAARIEALFDEDTGADADDDDALLGAQAQAVTLPLYTAASGDTDAQPRQGRFANVGGFSLHADVDVPAHHRDTLERMLRYAARPPMAASRLSWTTDGKVRLVLRKPWHTGQRDIIFEPLALLRRLAAAIPRPGQHLTRFHGVFAPNAAWRSALGALVPPPSRASTVCQKPPQQNASVDDANDLAASVPPAPVIDDIEPVPPRYRRPWAELLARTFGKDVLACPRCDGRLQRIQLVDDPIVIHRILTHLGLPTSLPNVAAPRSPPQSELDFDTAVHFDA